MIEEEQQGSERAQYGAKVLDSLSDYLTSEYGRGFSRSNLAGMRKFYLTYKEREPQIVQSGIGQFDSFLEEGVREPWCSRRRQAHLYLLQQKNCHGQ